MPLWPSYKRRHPNLDIQIDFKLLPYADLKQKGLSAIGNKTSIDLISLDQIWLGEFAQKGYLTDLTARAKEWGRYFTMVSSELGWGMVQPQAYMGFGHGLIYEEYGIGRIY